MVGSSQLVSGVRQQTFWQKEGFLILIDVLTVIKLKNLSTTYSCHVFLQENSGSNFYKELACSSLPHGSVRSYLKIGGNESKRWPPVTERLQLPCHPWCLDLVDSL
jgi:hypothetical protein